ncbi:hypothetical protein [Sulfuricurvum sp.]|uniref:hypothetical protein n=1 Tax=Sulfuricurvum sp. TaxID=2025608 RepID=UPI00260307E6|nr:hypothetical protein [Sulfuricurvum sp.]MDD3597137.1 hypothetical protein [Sulfuricurvum sp.]
MHFKQIVFSLIAISTIVSADQKPISQSIVEQLEIFGSSIKTTQNLDDNMISINTPISGRQMVGGRIDAVSYGHDVQNLIERNCLAYGGDVYFEKKDKFGDLVSMHSFNQEIVAAMSPQERMKYIEQNPNSKDIGDKYVIGWFDLRKKLFTDERLQRTFMFDTDYLRPESYYYNTTCKDPLTNKLIYTAHSKKVDGKYNMEYIDITFAEKIPNDLLKRPVATKTVDDVFAPFIEDKKDNKLLLQTGFTTILSTNYADTAHKYCDSLGGTTMIDFRTVKPGEQVNTSMKEKVACIGVEHPFTLKYYNLHFIISKDTLPEGMNALQATQSSASPSDPMKELAASVSTMPVGSTSENNIGNRKLVATVYASNGSSTLVNVQEAGNISALRNYQVTNGTANDITDPNWTFESISRLPKKMIDAKKALVNQCSAYGAAQLGVDNYTAVCVRQGAGSSCLANMIYARGNQFAGKESFGCK